MKPPILWSDHRHGAQLRTAVALAALLLVACVVDPARPLPIELCVLKRLTGWTCPTCGLTRAMCLALRGEWLASIHLHPAGPAAAAVFVVWTARAVVAAARSATSAWPIGRAHGC